MYALRLGTGQKQFSIHFYNSKFGILLLEHYFDLQNLSCDS
jgi:hypothetical protein